MRSAQAAWEDMAAREICFCAGEMPSGSGKEWNFSLSETLRGKTHFNIKDCSGKIKLNVLFCFHMGSF